MSNSDILEHICLQSINKLYKRSGKCDDQKKFKDIIEAAMVSTPEGFTYYSTRYTTTPTSVKKPSYRKSLCIFTNISDVKKKNTIR